MGQKRTLTFKPASGFTLTELVIALAVILILSAITLPIFSNALSSYRLTSTTGNLAGLIERDRFTAIQRNNLITLRQDNATGQLTFYLDTNSDGAMDVGDPRFLIPNGMQIMTPGGGVPGPSASGFPFPTAVPLSSVTGTVTFDARGTVNYGAGAPTVYMIVLGSPNQSVAGYRAITITPMGQTKTWTWSAQQSGGGSWVTF
jgi:prepilin-type N-terminal cleavage/methylation domain-containing protein